MKKKEMQHILIVFMLMLFVPFSNGYSGSSTSYDILISDLSFGGFEETLQPNLSVHFQMKNMPIVQGLSVSYVVTPGLARPLGPIAFSINVSPDLVYPDSIINCSGMHAFEFLDPAADYYRFDDTSLTINTPWNTSNTLDCSAAGCISGENMTCHFRVYDTNMNSSEITKTIAIMYKPVITSLNLDPIPAYTDDVLNCSAQAFDGDNDTITYYYLFNDTNDGILQNFSTNNLLDCQAVSGCDKHDNITCYVIASDGHVNSTINATNTVQILNSHPTLTGLTTNDSIINFGGHINITATGTNDNDTDNLRIECGNSSLTNNLCTGNYVFSNPYCDITIPWSDDTNHIIFCRVYDGENHSVQEHNITITSDNTLPEINLISPPNNTIWNISIVIPYKYNITDIHNIVSCNLIMNNIIIDSSSSIIKDITLNFTHVTRKGNFTWGINCTDEAGNQGASVLWNLTQLYDEYFWITNIGATGYEETNQNYTYTRSVINNLIVPDTATKCRFKNLGEQWTEWGECYTSFYWTLSKNDGNKTILVEINHTGADLGVVTNYTDWIILQASGKSLDTTAPEDFNITDDGDYTNQNEGYHATWQTPYDLETIIINNNFNYSYRLMDNTTGTPVTSWQYTANTEITISGLSLTENHTYILYVDATNPSGLTTQSISDGIIIDLTNPIMTNIDSMPQTNIWSNSDIIYINWSSEDSMSGAESYSMVLDMINNTLSDNLPEKDYENNRTYLDKSDGLYYFHIKPKDYAGNWGDTVHYGPIKIDKTSPSIPVLINPIEYGLGDIIFNWEQSTDELSGIYGYNVTITDINTSTDYINFTANNNYTFISTNNHNYYIIITAFDNAGNNISSQNPEISPVKIISAKPDSATVASDPIFRVETSKRAICEQNYTSKEFLFTNSTYHETKLKQSDNAYSIKITCTDTNGYKDEKIISYQVDKTSVIGSINIGIVNDTFIEKTVSVPLTVGNLGQIPKNKFKIYLNGTQINNFILINIDDNGSYMINFEAANPGNFTILVDVDGITDMITFKIKDIKLCLGIHGINNSDIDTKLGYSNINNKRAGLASQGSQASIVADSNSLKLNSSKNSKFYLFFTRKEFNAKNKNKLLEESQFSDETRSFGYGTNYGYNINTAIEYNNILIDGLEYLTEGRYSLFIQNIGFNDNNKTVLKIELE